MRRELILRNTLLQRHTTEQLILNPSRLVSIRLGDHGMQPLVVKVDKDRFSALQDAIDRAVVQIQKA